MSEKVKINIIGSGIGGLFSGAILAKHGFEVHIFESRVEIGGYCSSWKRGDYAFESSLHEMNGFYPDEKRLRTFRFLGLFDRIKLLKVPSLYTSVFNDFEFTVPHDLNEYRKKLIETFPDEEKGINKVLKDMQIISETGTLYMNETNILKAILQVPSKYPHLIPASFSTLNRFISNRIKNPRLKTIMSQLYLYYSDNINKFNLVYFAVPTFSLLINSYWVSGSSRTIVDALRDIIIENGGTVSTRKKVTKIIFNKKKAIGIEVNNDEKYFSDITICNTPINDTFERLIDKKDFGGFFRHRALHITPSTSIFTMYIGLKANAQSLGIKNYCYIFNEFDDLKDCAWKGKNVPHEKRPMVVTAYILDESLVTKDKTVLNICIADNEEYWEKYKDDKELYKAEKNRIANLLIDKIERKFPGFKNAIEILEIGTPYTMKRFSNNNAGAVYGAAQETFQTNLFRFPNEFKSRNLYFSSAWTSPGGGVGGAMLSGILASEKIIKRYKFENQLNNHIHPCPDINNNSLEELLHGN